MNGIRQVIEIDAWDGSGVVTRKYTVAPAMEEGTTNAVTNGNFNSSLSGWAIWQTQAGGTTTIVDGGYDSSNNSLSISHPYNAIAYSYGVRSTSALTGVVVGDKATFQFVFKGDTPNYIYVMRSSGGNTAITSGTITSIGNGWHRFVYTYTASSNADLNILVAYNGTASFSGEISQVQIEKKDHATSFVVGTRESGFPRCIIDPGLLQYSMFSGGKTSGASTYSFGEVVLNNADKGLDSLRDYDFDGRELRMYEGVEGANFPSEFTQIYSATVSGPPVFEWDKVSFPLKGKQTNLDIPAPSGIFQGDNTAPSGIEGGEDLKGKPKPLLLGRGFGISPDLCNSSKLIYAISPATGVAANYMGSRLAVYDMGVELICEGTYSGHADMEENAPTAGTYRVWEQGGYVRLGAPPAGLVTCDAVSYGRSVTSKPGNLIADLLTLADIAYDADDIAALNSSFSGECGVFAKGDNISALLDQICSACGAYWYFSPMGVLRVGQFVDPADLTAEYSLSTQGTQIYSAEIRKAQDTPGGIPAHTVTLLRGRNYTVQTSVAGAVPADRKLWMSQQWRKTQVVNASVKTAHPLSQELQIETSLTQDNAAEASRRFGLYSVPRDLAVLTLSLDAFDSTANVKPGICVSISLADTLSPSGNRFGYIDKKMILVAFTIDRVAERINATFWG